MPLKRRLMGLFGQGLSVRIFPALKVELGQNLRQEQIKRTPKKRPLRGEQRTPSFPYFSRSTGLNERRRSWQVGVIRCTRLAGRAWNLRCSWRPGYALERRKTNSFEGREDRLEAPSPPPVLPSKEEAGCLFPCFFMVSSMCLAQTESRNQNKRCSLRRTLDADGENQQSLPSPPPSYFACPNLTHPRTVKAAALCTRS